MKIGEFNHVAPKEGKSYLSDIPVDKRNAQEVRADRFSNWLILNHTGEDLWTPVALQILWAVNCALTVTRTELNYLQEHIGYAWHEVLAQYTRKEMSKMVVAQLWLQLEYRGYPTYNIEDECLSCHDFHQSPGELSECTGIYGPFYLPLLMASPQDLKQYTAAIMGTQSLLGLSKLGQSWLFNLGEVTIGDYDVTTGADFRELIQQRLSLLKPLSTLPLLVEFPMLGTDSKVLKMKGILEQMGNLQRTYKGPLVLVIPPYIPTAEDTWEMYNAGMKHHHSIYQMGLDLGRIYGVAVTRLIVQTEELHGLIMTRVDKWDNERLFSPTGRPLREFHRRVISYLKELVSTLHAWNPPEEDREQAVGYRSHNLEETEARD
jgi:hypothetical protein